MQTFKSNREYRDYMTHNASQIMVDNWRTACNVRKPGVFDARTIEPPQSAQPPIFFKGLNDHTPPYEKNATKMRFLEGLERYF